MFVDDLATHNTPALSTRKTYIASSCVLTRPNKQTTETITHCSYKQPHPFALAVHEKKIPKQSDNSWENILVQTPTVPKIFNECNPLDRPGGQRSTSRVREDWSRQVGRQYSSEESHAGTLGIILLHTCTKLREKPSRGNHSPPPPWRICQRISSPYISPILHQPSFNYLLVIPCM